MNVPYTVLEHQLLRDEKWRGFSKPIFDTAKKSGHSVVTAAEFMGKENNLLEFHRKRLFELEPPRTDFEKWMKLPPPKRRLVKPPT